MDSYVLCFQEDLMYGEDVAKCPSCSLLIKVIYDAVRKIFVHKQRIN